MSETTNDSIPFPDWDDPEWQQETVDLVVEYLTDRWGKVAPPCPYCRVGSWSVDPVPSMFERWGQNAGTGVPVFLIVCTNCGNEVPISVAISGLWEHVFGIPLEAPTAEEGLEPDEPEDAPGSIGDATSSHGEEQPE